MPEPGEKRAGSISNVAAATNVWIALDYNFYELYEPPGEGRRLRVKYREPVDRFHFRDHRFAMIRKDGLRIEWHAERPAECRFKRTKVGQKTYTTADCRHAWPLDGLVDRMECFDGEGGVLCEVRIVRRGRAAVPGAPLEEVRRIEVGSVSFEDHRVSFRDGTRSFVLWGYGYEVPCALGRDYMECHSAADAPPPEPGPEPRKVASERRRVGRLERLIEQYAEELERLAGGV